VQNNPLSILMLCSAMGSLFLALYTFQSRKNPTMRNMSLLLMAVTIWALGYSLELASINLQLMKFFASLAYVGIATIPVLWLIFVARYSGNDGWLTPLNQALLFVIPVVSILLVATNDLHHLFYVISEKGVSGNFSVFSTVPGLFWWVHVTYSYLAILAGLWLLVSLYFRVPQTNRFAVGLFIAALLLPYAANVAYVSGFKPYGFLDITPIAFIVMGVLLSFGAFTRKAMDVTPLAFDLLFKNIPDATFVIDPKGSIINTNPAAQKLLDSELSSENQDADLNKSINFAQRIAEYRGASEIELGQQIYTVSNTPILSSGKKVLGILVVLHDITVRKKTQVELEHRLEFENVVAKISATFVNLPSSDIKTGIDKAIEITGRLLKADRSYILLFNKYGTHFSVTNEWCAVGVSSQKERNQNFPVDKVPWWVEKARTNRYLYIEDVQLMPVEAQIDKEEFLLQEIQSNLAIPLKTGDTVIGIFGCDQVRDKHTLNIDQINLLTVIAELIANAVSRYYADEKIRFMSFHDQLTGLYNRHYLEEEMQRLDTERQLPISIIMADLNGLKLINDTYGHTRGDEMLKRTAAMLRETCRSEDIIARYGGDEFVLYLPRTPEILARKISSRIEAACRSEKVGDVPLSLSTGLAVKVNSKQKLSNLLKEAEDKLYQNKLTESRSGKSAIVNTLLQTLAAKSFETETHTRNMQEAAQRIGKKLGLPDSELRRLNLLITLHDIGKINIPEELLNKKEALTDTEWMVMKKHCETGYRIARATEEFAHVADDILGHHERWDGSGYPQGLKGEAIPQLARITAIADAFEVMSNGRPYKQALSRSEIVAEFNNCSGAQFDPQIVEIFLSIVGAVG
jgi:diguanylate cyclase (GGDEF)-like protein